MSGRVARWRHRHPAPKEPHVRFSPYTAQACQTPLKTRPFNFAIGFIVYLKIAVRVVEYQIGKRVVSALAVPMMQDEIRLIRYHLLTGWAEAVLDGVDPCFEPRGEGT